MATPLLDRVLALQTKQQQSNTFGEKPSSSPLFSRQRTCCVWSPPTPKFKQCNGSNILSQTFSKTITHNKSAPTANVYLLKLYIIIKLQEI